MSPRTPYKQKTPAEKAQSNWRKTLGLYKRGECSVAILRAAITCELMVNLALREELETARKLPSKFVDGLMKRANGITNKFHHLLIPILEGSDKHALVQALQTTLGAVNEERNKVAHQGEFKKPSTAYALLTKAHDFIMAIAIIYEVEKPEFAAPSPPKTSSNART